MEQGRIIIVSGFSGVGKDTVLEALMNAYPGEYVRSVSATTRTPRENEIPGISYHFISDEEFQKRIRNDEFLEYAVYSSASYGTPRQFVEDMLAQGKNVILKIEIDGALQVKEKHPETRMIYIVPPSGEELKKRLVGRDGNENPEKLQSRLNMAKKEVEQLDRYESIVVNDEVERCMEEIHRLTQDDGYRPSLPDSFLDALKEQIRKL